MYYATICAIAKNEAAYIEEWVNYHLSIGFEHVYVYDNNSLTPILNTLSRYVDGGVVTVIDFKSDLDQQRIAYKDCLHRYGAQSRWMAFIDIDEFVVPKFENDVRSVLDRYLEFGGLAIHWKIFGSGGRKEKAMSGVIKNYNKVVSFDRHVKSIVQPLCVSGVFTPHNFIYKDGFFCVNEDYIPVVSHQSYHTSKTIQLNHYYYKSREDFEEKILRGCATGADRDLQIAFSDFERQELLEGEVDRTIQDLVELKKKSMPELRDIFSYVDDCNKTHEQFKSLVLDCISINKLDLALKIVRTFVRYYDTPIVWLIAAKVYLLSENHKESLRYIQKLLIDVNSPFRGQGYACLVDYYRNLKDVNTADSLRQILEEK